MNGQKEPEELFDTPPPADEGDYGAEPPESEATFELQEGPAYEEGPALNGNPVDLDDLKQEHSTVAQPPLKIIDPTRWMNQLVPDRQWLVPGLIPLHNLTMLGGDGGLGKSILVLMLMAACALGKRWLGYPTKNCRAFGFFCEDDEDELHRRMVDICRYYKVELADLVGLELCSRVGLDNSLMEWRDAWKAGKITWLHTQIMNHCQETAAQLVVLDSHHDVFAGEENWRKHGRQFCQGLRKIALRIDGAVVITAHPSLSGRNSGTGESGTTAWHNSVRSRLYLIKADEQTDDCERILQHKKSNYGPENDDIRLRWNDGVFVAITEETGVIGSIKRGNAETVFMECLDTLTEQGRHVTDAANSPRFAPKQISQMPGASGYSKKEFKSAMERLFGAGRIVVGTAFGADRHKVKAIIRSDQEVPE